MLIITSDSISKLFLFIYLKIAANSQEKQQEALPIFGVFFNRALDFKLSLKHLVTTRGSSRDTTTLHPEPLSDLSHVRRHLRNVYGSRDLFTDFRNFVTRSMSQTQTSKINTEVTMVNVKSKGKVTRRLLLSTAKTSPTPVSASVFAEIHFE